MAGAKIMHPKVSMIMHPGLSGTEDVDGVRLAGPNWTDHECQGGEFVKTVLRY